MDCLNGKPADQIRSDATATATRRRLCYKRLQETRMLAQRKRTQFDRLRRQFTKHKRTWRSQTRAILLALATLIISSIFVIIIYLASSSSTLLLQTSGDANDSSSSNSNSFIRSALNNIHRMNSKHHANAPSTSPLLNDVLNNGAYNQDIIQPISIAIGPTAAAADASPSQSLAAPAAAAASSVISLSRPGGVVRNTPSQLSLAEKEAILNPQDSDSSTASESINSSMSKTSSSTDPLSLNAAAAAAADATINLVSDKSAMPIIIFTFNRASNLKRTLDSITSVLKHSKSKLSHPIFVSQDGLDDSVTQIVKSYQYPLNHLRFTYKAPSPMELPQFEVYYKIAQHYGWAIQQVMDIHPAKFEHVILLEDDMEISPDFFQYFTVASELMSRDPSLWCASAWNDNGQSSHVTSPFDFYRSDFFPGLGWLLTRRIWNEMSSKWPSQTGFWDDWLRLPEQRRDRKCIFP